MLAVPLPEKDVQPYLGENISLAVINGPSRCIVSGDDKAIEKLEKQLSGMELEGSRLKTSHAFHSKMMEPILDNFIKEVKKVSLNSPTIPILSNLTGTRDSSHGWRIRGGRFRDYRQSIGVDWSNRSGLSDRCRTS